MSIEERLTKIEKSLRKWRIAGLTLMALVAGLSAAVTFEFFGVRGTLRARRIHVVSARGAAIELETGGEGDGLISVHDSKGVPRALLGNSRRGFGMLELYGGAEQKLVSIGGSGSGGQIAVFNSSGHKVIDAQASKTNSGAIAVSDYDGNYAHGLFGDRR